MAPDEDIANPEESQPAQREPISPVKRKRLQKIFEHASKQMAQESYDYATELFGQCLVGDPGNLIYVQSYLGNLKKKYGNNRTGSRLAQFKERGARSGIKKALAQSAWDEVIAHGLKVLTVNPWDVAALTAMATAAQKSGDDECELFYLKCALEANSKDPEVNRQCALALAERQEFDQAIVCWHRVEQAKPNDDEAPRAIAALAVEKTIVRGGYEDGEETKKLGGAGRTQPQQQRREFTPEERLRQRIAREPGDMSAYQELAQLYLQGEDYTAAEEVYAKAFEASDGDIDIREKWEDTQIRRLRHQFSRATDEETKKKLRVALNDTEMEIFRGRVERYPNSMDFKYHLAVRLQFRGEYNEAIKLLQIARNDPRRKGVCMLSLGRCFEKIKQYRLSMTHYEAAIEEIPNRDAENKKDALYRIGRLSMDLKDIDKAEKYLSTLAGMDFSYKDVSELLDKIAQMRDNT